MVGKKGEESRGSVSGEGEGRRGWRWLQSVLKLKKRLESRMVRDGKVRGSEKGEPKKKDREERETKGKR